MRGSVQFSKVSVLGNHFVVVDESVGTTVAESAKSQFASAVADIAYGIGADNVLFVQRRLDQGRRRHGERNAEWSTSGSGGPIYTFRMFEPDGREGSMCGNGLAAASAVLSAKRRTKSANYRFLTELPTGSPRVRAVDCQWEGSGFRSIVRMGVLQAPPQYFIGPGLRLRQEAHGVSSVPATEVLVSCGAPFAPRQTSLIVVTALLLYTGEPHLVLIDLLPNQTRGGEVNLNEMETSDLLRLLIRIPRLHAHTRSDDDAADQALRAVGMHFNTLDVDRFPRGVNVMFARIVSAQTIVYRSFERDLNRETQSCGTGAVAIAAAAECLGLIDGSRSREVRMVPAKVAEHFRRGWADSPAQFVTREADGGWSFTTHAEIVFTGAWGHPVPRQMPNRAASAQARRGR